MINPRLILQIGVLVALVAAGFYVRHVFNHRNALIEERGELQSRIEQSEAGNNALVKQLEQLKQRQTELNKQRLDDYEAEIAAPIITPEDINAKLRFLEELSR